jgi:antitoxin VapB
MSLNIKDPQTHKLVKQLAHETGESLTTAVSTAVRERLGRIRKQRDQAAKLKQLIEFGRKGAELFPGPHIDHADLLYDENGLPK